jgi:hypothetical protein
MTCAGLLGYVRGRWLSMFRDVGYENMIRRTGRGTKHGFCRAGVGDALV